MSRTKGSKKRRVGSLELQEQLKTPPDKDEFIKYKHNVFVYDPDDLDDYDEVRDEN